MSELAPITLDDLLSRLKDLPAMPAVVMDLVASIDDDEISLEQLARKIERDQVLASKTLRIANSPFFGLSGRIASIQEAATVIGLRSLRSIALASAVSGVVGKAGGDSNMHEFWRHAFETAVAARLLAQGTKIAGEHAFIAGLLHDIGKIAVSACCPEVHDAIRHYCAEQHCDWASAEEALGVPDHGLVGQALAKRWKFPDALADALGHYHAPAADASLLVQIIHVADVLSHCCAIVDGQDVKIGRVDERAWAGVIRDEAALKTVLRSLRNAGDVAGHLG